jgi:hypothetical protein
MDVTLNWKLQEKRRKMTKKNKSKGISINGQFVSRDTVESTCIFSNPKEINFNGVERVMALVNLKRPVFNVNGYLKEKGIAETYFVIKDRDLFEDLVEHIEDNIKYRQERDKLYNYIVEVMKDETN